MVLEYINDAGSDAGPPPAECGRRACWGRKFHGLTKTGLSAADESGANHGNMHVQLPYAQGKAKNLNEDQGTAGVCATIINFHSDSHHTPCTTGMPFPALPRWCFVGATGLGSGHSRLGAAIPRYSALGLSHISRGEYTSMPADAGFSRIHISGGNYTSELAKHHVDAGFRTTPQIGQSAGFVVDALVYSTFGGISRQEINSFAL